MVALDAKYVMGMLYVDWKVHFKLVLTWLRSTTTKWGEYVWSLDVSLGQDTLTVGVTQHAGKIDKRVAVSYVTLQKALHSFEQLACVFVFDNYTLMPLLLRGSRCIFQTVPHFFQAHWSLHIPSIRTTFCWSKKSWITGLYLILCRSWNPSPECVKYMLHEKKDRSQFVIGCFWIYSQYS